MRKTTIPTAHLTIFLLLLGVIVVLFFLTQKQLRLVNLAQAETNNLAENRVKLADLSDSLPGVAGETNVWLRALPSDEEGVARFAASLEQLARDRSLTVILDFDDFPETIDIAGKLLPGLGLQINLEGSFDNVRSFMSDLAKMNYFYKTDKITVLTHETKPGVKASFTGSLMLNIDI